MKARHPRRRSKPAKGPTRGFLAAGECLAGRKRVVKNRILLRVEHTDVGIFRFELRQKAIEIATSLQHLRRDCRGHQDDVPDDWKRTCSKEQQRFQNYATSQRMSDEI